MVTSLNEVLNIGSVRCVQEIQTPKSNHPQPRRLFPEGLSLSLDGSGFGSPAPRHLGSGRLVTSKIRVQHDAVTGLARFESGEGLVDIAHREMLGLRRYVVP